MHLQKLCKVWGFVKYHHPAVVNGGEADWDQALLEILPDVLEARDTTTLNTLLFSWVDALGSVESIEDTAATDYQLPPEIGRWVSPLMGWIEDEAYLGEALSRRLIELKQIHIENRDMPLDRIEMGVRAPFYWEKTYGSAYHISEGHRLLALFRYWNAFAYYSPYTDIMDEDWDAVLARMIPTMLAAKDNQSYLLCLSELTAATQDAHAMVFSSDILQKHFGPNLPPVLFTQVEGQIVILEVSPEFEETCPLQPGDIVLALDGTPIAEVIRQQIRYVSVPYPDKVAGRLQFCLFRSKNKSMRFRVLRGQQEAELDVPCLQGTHFAGNELPSHEWVAQGIGLLNPGFLAQEELPLILEEFKDADGFIVDLRQYPAVPLMLDMPSFVYAQTEIFNIISFPDYGAPGEFMMLPNEMGEENPNYYRGKLVILIDQTSMSQPEFTAMLLRKGPSAIVMGENSLGADGDVIGVPLPGNTLATFSGIGIFTPEGNQTQRIGVAPDIYVYRTIEGIREGRDELLEAAIAHILKP